MKAIPAIHPAALLFPAMTAEEYAALRDDIREHGLLHPIVMHDEQILDGRHRYRACVELGIEPETTYYLGECGSPISFVLSENAKRRHLDKSQLAAIAVEALPLYEAEAKERQREAIARGNVSRHQPKTEAPVPQRIAELGEESPVEPVPDRIEREARTQAAAAIGTNRQYVSDAKRLKNDAPDLFEEVRQGEKTIPEAKREAERREIEAAVETIERATDRLDTDGSIAAARLHHAVTKALKFAVSDWLPLQAEAVAAVIDDDDLDRITDIAERIGVWADAVRAARIRPFSVVGGSR